MQSLRTHTCGELNVQHLHQRTTLMGWVHTKRNLGGLIFIDLRDHYGLTQIVIPPEAHFFKLAAHVRQESVIQITGKVARREGACNPKIFTGEIEVVVEFLHVESPSEILPFPISHNPKKESDDSRLTYRYLDLRTSKMHENILFRSQVIRYLRDQMHSFGFVEFNTPILTTSSPEGARDFLVPSRLHPGHFYALPQAPQQFKQLLMCAGFDKYFQIAPCFRDEDPRADRAPGEFYQLDLEMSFVSQDNVLQLVEKLMRGLFENSEFTQNKILPLSFYSPQYVRDHFTFPCLPWHDALDLYGTDKPDLRFALEMQNVEEIFKHTRCQLFQNILQKNGLIRAIVLPNGALQSRKFFDEAERFAKENALNGLPWLLFQDASSWKGPLAKQFSEEEKQALVTHLQLKENDAVVFVVGIDKLKTQLSGGKIRNYFGEKLRLKNSDVWSFVWIVDFPLFEYSEEEGKIVFSHNPFSMPQGGLDALEHKNPLDILAYQYDLVCNGIELSSGAIRNHRRDIMQKVFEIAGYSETELQTQFGALWTAFAYGAPPHGGIAPGIDRMIMLLKNESNIREIIAFPLNQKAIDPMMKAPCLVSEKHLEAIHIQRRSSCPS